MFLVMVDIASNLSGFRFMRSAGIDSRRADPVDRELIASVDAKEVCVKAFCLKRRPALVLAVAIAVLGVVATPAVAGPLFPMPAFPGAGFPIAPFVVHMATGGPVFLPPGAALGPIVFGDGLASPDPHHWEIEINNPGAIGVPLASNVIISGPGGLLVTGFLTLAPGASAYFTFPYADIPDAGGLYSFTAANPIGPGATPFFVDSDVLEYLAPTIGPGAVGPLFLGGPGAFGAFAPGLPSITLTIGVVPEPSTILAFAGLGGLAVLAVRKRMTKLPT